ncbi:MAG: alkaline phosphatase family protein [Candidatus Omnitrophica bacterium]|nr:alkaline phosphatase family protein [Candidatus Omnitrophota bacterium]
MNKIIYIILDGLGDVAVSALGGKTPLDAAFTPAMDRLAQRGSTGTVGTVNPGIAPESDIAVISLLGYDPAEYYTGRGPLEAFSEGITIQEGNLALRANFATVEADGKTIKDRRAARSVSTEEALGLAKEVNARVTLKSATFEFKSTVGHRAVLVIRGVRSKLSGNITNTDPAYERKGAFGVARENFPMLVYASEPLAAFANDTEAREAAALVNEITDKSYRVLQQSAINKRRIEQGKLPANLVLCRSAGDCLPNFTKADGLYKMKFGCFVEMPVERGIALLTGMEIIDVPSASGHLDVDYPVWAKVALNALAKYDGLYVHIKGPDEAGHDGDPQRKKEIIEAIDEFYVKPLVAELDLKDTIVCISSDLSTVCEVKAHSSMPVPLLVCGGSIKPDGSLSFSEKACQAGSLGEIKGTDLLPFLVKTAQA